MTTDPIGSPTRAELKLDALQALARADLDRPNFEGPRELTAIYEALRALTYATLADGEPTIENQLVATFGEPSGRHHRPEPAPPMPLFTVQWNYSDGPSHPKLELVEHGDEEHLDVVVLTWNTADDEVDDDGMIRDVAALAAWVADGVIASVARRQGWDPGPRVATILRAADILSGAG